MAPSWGQRVATPAGPGEGLSRGDRARPPLHGTWDHGPVARSRPAQSQEFPPPWSAPRRGSSKGSTHHPKAWSRVGGRTWRRRRVDRPARGARWAPGAVPSSGRLVVARTPSRQRSSRLGPSHGAWAHPQVVDRPVCVARKVDRPLCREWRGRLYAVPRSVIRPRARDRPLVGQIPARSRPGRLTTKTGVAPPRRR